MTLAIGLLSWKRLENLSERFYGYTTGEETCWRGQTNERHLDVSKIIMLLSNKSWSCFSWEWKVRSILKLLQVVEYYCGDAKRISSFISTIREDSENEKCVANNVKGFSTALSSSVLLQAVSSLSLVVDVAVVIHEVTRRIKHAILKSV